METSLPVEQQTAKIALAEYAEPGKPLGRHVHHDARSWSYPAQRADGYSDVKHAATGLPLTQLDTHRCATAHALCAAVNAAPGRAPRRQPLTQSDAMRIYDAASAVDGFDVDGERVPGSSALMACRAARSLGLISAYEHAFGLEHALEALMLRPVMTGIGWYSSFDGPDPRTGLVEISPGATVRGGHEVVADEIDANRGLAWFWNSWGPEFGIGGRFCMTFETWDRLLHERGDVTVPII